MIIVLLISLYSTRLILQALGVEDYGVYNVVAGFVSMFSFLNNSMAGATQRFYNYELGKNGIIGARTVYCASFKIHLYLAIIIALLTEPIGIWYIRNKMVLPDGVLTSALCIFHFSVATLFVNIISTPFIAAVMANERMDFYAIVESLNAFLKFVAAFTLTIVNENKLIIYGFCIFAISVLLLLIYVCYARMKFQEIRLGIKVPKTTFKDILSFSGWGTLGSISYILRDQGVNLLLNSFFGTIVNAARGVSNQINGALQSFISNLVVPSRPQVIQSFAQDNAQRALKLTFSISKITCILFYMISLPICLEINFILSLWLGKNVPEYTSSFVILLLATNVFGTYVYPLNTLVSATGRIRFFQITSSASNLLTLPLAYVFIKMCHSPNSAYFALFVTMVTNVLTSLIAANRFVNVSYFAFLRQVVFPCIIIILLSLPFGFIPVLTLPSGFVRLIIGCIISLSSVSILSYYIALDRNERMLIHNIGVTIKKRFCK